MEAKKWEKKVRNGREGRRNTEESYSYRRGLRNILFCTILVGLSKMESCSLEWKIFLSIFQIGP